MQMSNWANFRLTGTYNTSLDGELVQFQDITKIDLKTNLTLPTEITESYRINIIKKKINTANRL